MLSYQVLKNSSLGKLLSDYKNVIATSSPFQMVTSEKQRNTSFVSFATVIAKTCSLDARMHRSHCFVDFQKIERKAYVSSSDVEMQGEIFSIPIFNMPLFPKGKGENTKRYIYVWSPLLAISFLSLVMTVA